MACKYTGNPMGCEFQAMRGLISCPVSSAYKVCALFAWAYLADKP